MQETITQMSEQMTQKWEGLTKSQKVKIGIGLGAIALIIVIGLLTLNRPSMQMLYRGLDLRDAAEVTEVLDNEGIAYEVSDGGTSIAVKEDQFNQAKLILAQSNVPRGKYTFEDAIDNSMSTTESEKAAKMHEFKKAEIERSLEMIDSVNYANVNLEIPEERNAFIASTQQSKASIVLDLNSSMSSQQIEGVARLVAGSVEQLEMENVTIIDTSGNTLYSGENADELSLTKQQEAKQVAEADVVTKVNQLLQPIYGDVSVSPNLVLDFEHYEEIREEYLPTLGPDENRGLIDSETITSSNSTNIVQGEEPGVGNNGGDIPNYTIGGANGVESSSKSEDVKYLNDRVTSNTVKNQGDILYDESSIAVHVFEDQLYYQESIEPTLQDGISWEDFKVANASQTPFVVEQEVVQSVRNATGIENVVVNGYQRPVFIDAEPYVISRADYLPYLAMIIVVIIGALTLFKFRNHNQEVAREEELELKEMLNITKEQQELESISIEEELESKKQIEKFVEEKPEAVANLLRNWLTEDEWE